LAWPRVPCYDLPCSWGAAAGGERWAKLASPLFTQKSAAGWNRNAPRRVDVHLRPFLPPRAGPLQTPPGRDPGGVFLWPSLIQGFGTGRQAGRWESTWLSYPSPQASTLPPPVETSGRGSLCALCRSLPVRRVPGGSRHRPHARRPWGCSRPDEANHQAFCLPAHPAASLHFRLPVVSRCSVKSAPYTRPLRPR
jgi:hypothetical protein